MTGSGKEVDVKVGVDPRAPAERRTVIDVQDHHRETDDRRETVFDVDGLAVYYGDFRAVRDVTLPVRRNEITALIGPSGCGKTTVLRCLNRMNDLVPDARIEGSVRYHGVDLYGDDVDPVEVRRRIGMVFQKPNPFPKSIEDNVLFGPKIAGFKGDTAELVEQSLRRAALWDEVKDKLKQSAMALSGGQQQRLCIARAIATRPDVILMDEPCSALDPIATQRIEDLMQELVADYTIVIVTHNMQQAARVSDRTAFFTVDVERGGPPDRDRRRVRPDRDDLHEPRRRAHRGLRDGAVRMTQRLHEELESLELEVLAMGELSERAVGRAIDALVRRDEDLAQQVIDADDEIDDRYLDIEHRTIELLALQTPVATDLRLLSAMLHINLHLERIGDQAVNIAKTFLSVKRPDRQRSGAIAHPRDGRHRAAHDPDRHGGLPEPGPVAVPAAAGDGRPRRPAEPRDVPGDRRARRRSGAARVGTAHARVGAQPRARRRQRRRRRRAGGIPAHR